MWAKLTSYLFVYNAKVCAFFFSSKHCHHIHKGSAVLTVLIVFFFEHSHLLFGFYYYFNVCKEWFYPLWSLSSCFLILTLSLWQFSFSNTPKEYLGFITIPALYIFLPSFCLLMLTILIDRLPVFGRTP